MRSIDLTNSLATAKLLSKFPNRESVEHELVRVKFEIELLRFCSECDKELDGKSLFLEKKHIYNFLAFNETLPFDERIDIDEDMPFGCACGLHFLEFGLFSVISGTPSHQDMFEYQNNLQETLHEFHTIEKLVEKFSYDIDKYGDKGVKNIIDCSLKVEVHSNGGVTKISFPIGSFEKMSLKQVFEAIQSGWKFDENYDQWYR